MQISFNEQELLIEEKIERDWGCVTSFIKLCGGGQELINGLQGADHVFL